jgi:hypothetical protein
MTDTTAQPAAEPSAQPAAAPAPTTPPAATNPPPPQVFNPDGTFAENWHVALGDEFAPHAETASRFKNPGDLLKSYIHLRQHGPAYPTETATADDVSRFRTLANVPNTPDGYNLPIPEQLPEGVQFDGELAKQFAEVAHAHHVPAPALQALMAKQLEVETARYAEAAQREADAKKQAQDSLVADWRGDFQRNASTVRHITNKIGEAAGVPEEQISELANNPAFARMMLHVSRLSSEDSIAAPAGLGDLRSPADRAEMIMTGKDPVWGDKYQNGDPEAYNTVVNLLKQAKR